MERATIDMRGKVCLITGATSGIGKATALGLAMMGTTICVVSRDASRGAATVDEIKHRSGNTAVELVLADLTSQRAIDQLVDTFKRTHQHLHVLVNNAGGVFPCIRTADGLEKTFALNHLAPFLLTNLLLDLLTASAPARIVNVSSGAERGGQINFDDLQGEKKYSPMRAYFQSKLANVLFSYELARRLEGTGVTVNALQPGTVATNFGHDLRFVRWIYRLGRPLMRTPEQGAETVIYFASAPELETVTGTYFQDCKPIRSSPRSYDEGVARRLWHVSAELTHLPV